MSWDEYVLKSYAYNRMQLDKWEHTRFIAYKATLAPHLNHKFIPKSIEKFFPLKRKINQIDVSDESKKVYIEHYKKYLEDVAKANQN